MAAEGGAFAPFWFPDPILMGYGLFLLAIAAALREAIRLRQEAWPDDMSIRVNLDILLAQRRMKLNELSDLTGIPVRNLSVLKTGKARAIRFSTLNALCEALACQPGDLLAHGPGPQDD